MTRVLTDAPEWAGPWLEASGCGWHGPVPVRWADALTGSPELWEASLPGWTGWDAVLVTRRAPRSQVDALADLHERGASLPPRLLCHAEEGTGFHGQRERAWATLPGNLHVSARWPLDLAVAEVGHVLTAVPALAVADALEGLVGLGDVGLKWVNDVVIGDGKTAGVIVRTHLNGDRFEGAVFGIGLNLGVTPELPGDVFVPRATSLRDEIGPAAPAPAALLEALAGTLRARVEQLNDGGPAPLVEAYRARAVFLGRRVAVHEDRLDGSPGPVIARGRVVGIGEQLELWMEGREEPIVRGRLALEPPPKAQLW